MSDEERDDLTEEQLLAGAVTLGADEVRALLDRLGQARREQGRLVAEATAQLQRTTDVLDEAAEALHRAASTIEDRNVLLAGQVNARARRLQALRTLPPWLVSILTLAGTVLVYALARLLGVPIPGGAP